MLVSGSGSASWLGHSLSAALTRAADGTKSAARAAFQSLSIEPDPLAPDIALYGVPETGGFQDRTVTTTVDEIELKIDVARVTKGVSDAAGARGDSATEMLRIRVETTVDPLNGQQTRVTTDPQQATSGTLDAKELDRIARGLADGQGAFQGVVSLDDHRTITHTYYQTRLEKGPSGLVQTEQISTDARTYDFADTAQTAVTFDASKAHVETPAQIAQRLAYEYSGHGSLAAHIPGLNFGTRA